MLKIFTVFSILWAQTALADDLIAPNFCETLGSPAEAEIQPFLDQLPEIQKTKNLIKKIDRQAANYLISRAIERTLSSLDVISDSGIQNSCRCFFDAATLQWINDIYDLHLLTPILGKDINGYSFAMTGMIVGNGGTFIFYNRDNFDFISADHDNNQFELKRIVKFKTLTSAPPKASINGIRVQHFMAKFKLLNVEKPNKEDLAVEVSVPWLPNLKIKSKSHAIEKRRSPHNIALKWTAPARFGKLNFREAFPGFSNMALDQKPLAVRLR